jgi:hypothetical protein
MTFPGVDCESRAAGNNSTVTEEPIVLSDLSIMSDELFIAFDEVFWKVKFFGKKMVNLSCEYVSILIFKPFLFGLPD